MAIKPRSDNRMIALRGRTWNGEDAVTYLYNRLTGEDGEKPWSAEEAAKRVTGKLRVRITDRTISKWLKSENQLRRAKDNFEAVTQATLEFLTNQDAKNLAQMVDTQIVLMIGRIHMEDGTEEAIDAVRAFTALRKTMIDEGKLEQQKVEYQESVKALRARIDALTSELKARGFDPAALDELNKRTVSEIDEMIRKGTPAKG